MDFESDHASVERSDRVATVVVDGRGPENLIDRAVAADVRDAVAFVEDSDARAAVVRGAGGTFSGGGDLTQDPEDFVATIDTAVEAILDVYESGTPYVAAVESAAAGGGAEFALACDLRVAGREATFRLPETRVGIIPPAGVIRMLAQSVGMAKARELLLTGRPFAGEEAADLGLVARTVDDDEVLNAAADLAGDLSRRSPASMAATIKSLNEAFPRPVTRARWDLELARNLARGPEFEEGKQAFFEGREPEF